MNNFERDVANAMLDAADGKIMNLEESLAKYQAARVHDVDEKAWLSKRVTELEAENAKLKSMMRGQTFVTAPETFAKPIDPDKVRQILDLETTEVVAVSDYERLWNALLACRIHLATPAADNDDLSMIDQIDAAMRGESICEYCQHPKKDGGCGWHNCPSVNRRDE